MEKELAQGLLAVCRAYSEATGLMESTVGRKFTGDGRFFANLRNGLGFTVRKYDSVMHRFSTHWPEGAEWPAGVVRPPAQITDAQEAAE